MHKQLFNLNSDHLIKIRIHLGHSNSELNLKLTNYLYGTLHNINIFHIKFLIKYNKYLFYCLSENFYKRSSIFIIGTNPNLPMEIFLYKLMQRYPFIIKKNRAFYVSGYLDKKWVEGLFSNWQIFKGIIEYFNDRPNFVKTQIKSRFEKYFPYINGVRNLYKMPLPDYFLILNEDPLALQEIKKLNIPLMGFIDSNMDPEIFIYKFFGNNESIESLEFFFLFLEECIKEGRLKEQRLFAQYLIYKIKNIISKKKINNKEFKNKTIWIKSSTDSIEKFNKNNKLKFNFIQTSKIKPSLFNKKLNGNNNTHTLKPLKIIGNMPDFDIDTLNSSKYYQNWQTSFNKKNKKNFKNSKKKKP